MTIIAILAIAVSAKAMSYEQARREALFLTDKMAYELNLNDSQYDAAYEINLDYLMGVTSRNDIYGTYWTRRNADFGYILLDWQWRAFCAATYFYRPLFWEAGYWHFGIYARYPRRDYFYFSRPTVYISYRGGHSWRSNGGRSYYQGRKKEFSHNTASHRGLRDRWNNGEFHNKNNNHGGGSSTRVTVNNKNTKPNTGSTSTDRNNPFGGNRSTSTNRQGQTDNRITSERNLHISTKRIETSADVTGKKMSDMHQRPSVTTTGKVTTAEKSTTANRSITTSKPTGATIERRQQHNGTATSTRNASEMKVNNKINMSRSSTRVSSPTHTQRPATTNISRGATQRSVKSTAGNNAGSNSAKSSNGFGGRR